MTYLLFVQQILLAAIFLLAASGKLLKSEQFLSALRLSHIPDWLLSPMIIGIPCVELGLSIGLVMSSYPLLSWFFAGTSGLLGIFTLWMIFISLQKLRIKCGCFGTASSQIGLHSIVRNILLLSVSLWGLFISSRMHHVFLEPSLWMFMLMLSLGICFVLLQAFWSAKPVLLLQRTN